MDYKSHICGFSRVANKGRGGGGSLETCAFVISRFSLKKNLKAPLVPSCPLTYPKEATPNYNIYFDVVAYRPAAKR
jgi:hypothetical protein